MCSLAIYCFFIYFVRHGTADEKVESYAGAQVWRTNLRSAQDAHAIRALADQQAISLWNLNNKFVDFLIHAADQVKVSRVLRARGLESSTIITDVQRTLDELRPKPSSIWNENALRNGHRLDWKNYPPLGVIDEYLQHLVKKFPSLCKLTTIGRSVEKKPLKMLRISNGNPKNKAIMMTAGIHAREWIAITSALYLIDTIATNFDELPNYMKSVDWSIIPVLNPDGYEYSYTKDRLWRKNRQKSKQSKCVGVDLNRNFDYDWYVPSLASNSCDTFEQYSGRYPFSEPETEAIRNLIQKSEKIPEAFIDVHSYGQLILYPWGSKPNKTKNNQLLDATGTAMSQAIFRATRKKYTVGNVYKTVYPTSGMQIDWFLSLGVTYSYVFELRDSRGIGSLGRGFLLPPEHIEPTGNDLVAAMKQLAEVLARKKDIQMPKENKQLRKTNKENQLTESEAKTNKKNHLTESEAKTKKEKQLTESKEATTNKENHLTESKEAKTNKENHLTESKEAKTNKENHLTESKEATTNKENHLTESKEAKTNKENHLTESKEAKTNKENHLTESKEAKTNKENHLTESEEAKTSKEKHLTESEEAETNKEKHLTKSEEAKTSKEKHLTESEEAETNKEKHLTKSEEAKTNKEKHLTELKEAKTNKEKHLTESEEAKTN